MKHAMFSAEDIQMLLRKSDLDTLVKRAGERVPACPFCGKYHVLPYAGVAYCQSPHHVAHGPTGALSPREKELALRFGAKEEDL